MARSSFRCPGQASVGGAGQPFERHRQVVGAGLTEMAGRRLIRIGVQATAVTSLTSAHAWNARILAARCSLAEAWLRRRWKRLAI